MTTLAKFKKLRTLYFQRSGQNQSLLNKTELFHEIYNNFARYRSNSRLCYYILLIKVGILSKTCLHVFKEYRNLNILISDYQELRHEIILENEKLVHKICHKYQHCTKEPYEDLAQVGMAALVAVVDKFDPDLGYQFSTLAYLRVEGDIRNHLMNRTTTIRFPRRIYAAYNQLRRARKQLTGELGRQPSYKELSEILGKSVEELKQIEFDFGSISYYKDEILAHDKEGAIPKIDVNYQPIFDSVDKPELEAYELLAVQGLKLGDAAKVAGCEAGEMRVRARNFFQTLEVVFI